jgi:hypothetical protein
MASVIETAGLPPGVIRDVRRGPGRSLLHVEWVAQQGWFVVTLRAEAETPQVISRVPCLGWRCFVDAQGSPVAWLQSASGSDPVNVHVADGTTMSGDMFAMDAFARFFAIQRGQEITIGELRKADLRGRTSRMTLNAVVAAKDGPIVIGVREESARVLVAERFDASLKTVSDAETSLPFRYFDVADYSAQSGKLLVREFRDDPFCSRLWTWHIGRDTALVGGQCASDVDLYADSP